MDIQEVFLKENSKEQSDKTSGEESYTEVSLSLVQTRARHS